MNAADWKLISFRYNGKDILICNPSGVQNPTSDSVPHEGNNADSFWYRINNGMLREFDQETERDDALRLESGCTYIPPFMENTPHV